MERKRELLKQKSVNIISHVLGVPVAVVTEEKTINDLSHDSIKLFELLLAFEEAFSIRTTYEDVIQLKTVGDIIEYVVHNPEITLNES